jgi:hypothetical protein
MALRARQKARERVPDGLEHVLGNAKYRQRGPRDREVNVVSRKERSKVQVSCDQEVRAGQRGRREQIENHEPSAHRGRFVEDRDYGRSDRAREVGERGYPKRLQQDSHDKSGSEARDHAQREPEAPKAQRRRVYRDRAYPTELEKDHRQGADDIDVAERVECQPLVVLRSSIAQDARDAGKGESMDRNEDESCAKSDYELMKGQVEHGFASPLGTMPPPGTAPSAENDGVLFAGACLA